MSDHGSKLHSLHIKGELRIVDSIRAGDRVTIVDRFGVELSGRAVMRGPAGWVLNMGGRYGTPGIASEENTTRVAKPRARKPRASSRHCCGDECRSSGCAERFR